MGKHEHHERCALPVRYVPEFSRSLKGGKNTKTEHPPSYEVTYFTTTKLPYNSISIRRPSEQRVTVKLRNTQNDREDIDNKTGKPPVPKPTMYCGYAPLTGARTHIPVSHSSSTPTSWKTVRSAASSTVFHCNASLSFSLSRSFPSATSSSSGCCWSRLFARRCLFLRRFVCNNQPKQHLTQYYSLYSICMCSMMPTPRARQGLLHFLCPTNVHNGLIADRNMQLGYIYSRNPGQGQQLLTIDQYQPAKIVVSMSKNVNEFSDIMSRFGNATHVCIFERGCFNHWGNHLGTRRVFCAAPVPAVKSIQLTHRRSRGVLDR